ncbi:MAG: hypothetical protein H6858_00875 [Rhodospirillales bacterium]|nr:hypothetical protein [Alphaproteobacteria bacterium]MCB1838782.1 hypothetical protein [Alphaproteobacteria bacterium]MCB9976133.1 hypothetical protein [Rhodospirillales bacterium]
MEGLRALLSMVGLVLVIAGAGFLLYVGFTVIKIIDTPEDIKILSVLFENIKGDEKVIYGNAGPQDFNVYFSPRLQKIIYSVLGLMILAVMTQLIGGLLSAGVRIIRAAYPAPRPDSFKKSFDKRDVL